MKAGTFKAQNKAEKVRYKKDEEPKKQTTGRISKKDTDINTFVK